MRHAFQALVWEQVWKNRIVFPLLALLLVLGAGLTGLVRGADPDAWWVTTARRTLAIAFLASVPLSFAPFTLMESPHGWRMNSMVTRWFVLPVRTGLLVLVPFVAGCLVVGCFLGAWLVLFRRLIPELDFGHVLWVLLLGVAVMQTLAWVLPRKPGQFWPLLALWFPALLILAVLPLDGDSWEAQRRWVKAVVPSALPLLGWVAYTAARLNRSGVWPGEIPMSGLLRWVFRPQMALPPVRTPTAALFWSDVVPVVRTFLVTWIGFFLMVLAIQLLQFFHRSHARQLTLDLALVLQVSVMLMPPLGVLWLAVGGLFLGPEPGMGFRTFLSPFRAVRPVSAGTLAAQRVGVAVCLWLLVWVPWLVLLAVHTRLHPRWAGIDIPGIYAGAGRTMAISAHVLVGALPFFLWGRLEGFPNLLLAALVAWAGTWCLASFFGPAAMVGWLWIPLGILVTFKLCLGVGALVWAWHDGHITWRYAVGLAAGSTIGVSLLVWMLPTWDENGWWGLATVALFLPFARLACAPVVLAANRHR